NIAPTKNVKQSLTPTTSPATATAISTQTAIAISTQTGTSGPPTFRVSSVTASASPNNFNGVCSSTMRITFVASINVPAGTSGGMVTYQWLAYDGSSSGVKTISFNAGVTSQIVTDSQVWDLDAGYTGWPFWDSVQVTAPNSVSSGRAYGTFNCQ